MCNGTPFTILKKIRLKQDSYSNRSFIKTNCVEGKWPEKSCCIYFFLIYESLSLHYFQDQFKFIHEALETFITSEEFRGEPVEAEVPQIIADDDD